MSDAVIEAALKKLAYTTSNNYGRAWCRSCDRSWFDHWSGCPVEAIRFRVAALTAPEEAKPTTPDALTRAVEPWIDYDNVFSYEGGHPF